MLDSVGMLCTILFPFGVSTMNAIQGQWIVRPKRAEKRTMAPWAWEHLHVVRRDDESEHPHSRDNEKCNPGMKPDRQRIAQDKDARNIGQRDAKEPAPAFSVIPPGRALIMRGHGHLEKPSNEEVSDGSQPPLTFDLSPDLNGWLPFAGPSC